MAFGLGSSRVIFTLVYLIARSVLGLLARQFRRDLSKDAELLVLRHENAVLRRHAVRVRYEPADRAWLCALARLIPRRRWSEVFPVTLATLLAWHRKLAAGKYDTSKLAEEAGREVVERNRSGAGDLFAQPVVQLGEIGSGYRPGVVPHLYIGVTVVYVSRVAPEQGADAALLIVPVDRVEVPRVRVGPLATQQRCGRKKPWHSSSSPAGAH